MLKASQRKAIERADTEAGKIAAAVDAMIETPLWLIEQILRKHETACLEIMREQSKEISSLRSQRDMLMDSAKDVVAWCDKNPPAGDALYCIKRLRHAVVEAENVEVQRRAGIIGTSAGTTGSTTRGQG